MKNQAQEEIKTLRLTVGAGVLAGDVVMVGKICGVAETDYSAVDGKATLRIVGSYKLSVKGINDAGNSAVAVGDRIYWLTGDTPQCSKKASGQLVGIALGAVIAAATTTIEVALIGMPSADINPTGAHIADVGACAVGYVQAEANALKDKINAIIAALEVAGIVASA